jgi:hypothetical protein
MSKYVKVETEIKDESLFVDALREVCREEGIEFEQGSDLALYGFQGDQRRDTADYVIRREHIERLANDLGFKRHDDGIQAIISEYDQSHRAQSILNTVKRRYAVKAVRRAARRAGHTVREEAAEDNSVRLRIRV